MDAKEKSRFRGTNGVDDILWPFKRPVKQKIEKTSPWHTWRKKRASQIRNLDRLLAASTREERVRILRTRFYEVPVLREKIKEL